MARIINHLGSPFRHTIIALDGNIGAKSRLHPDIAVELVPLTVDKGRPVRNLIQYYKLLQNRRPNLLVTYNWGAIEWAFLNRVRRFCRHIHHEAGFSVEEADRQLRRRVILRRIALATAEKIIVPSRTLLEIAATVWRLPAERLLYIPNGIDLSRFEAPRERFQSNFVERRPYELIVGTVAPLRPEKNIARMLRAFVPVARRFNARLIVVGDGRERQHLTQLTAALGIMDRVTFTGNIDQPEQILPAFDIFAISSDTEQMPNTVLEAMAAGLPVVATDVGDIRYMLAPENASLLVAKEDEAALSSVMADLLSEATKRKSMGDLNRQHAVAHHCEEQMFTAYRAALSGE